MVCEFCNTRSENNAEFCSNCGAPLKKETSKVFSANTQSSQEEASNNQDYVSNANNKPSDGYINPSTNTYDEEYSSVTFFKQNKKQIRILIIGLALLFVFFLIPMITNSISATKNINTFKGYIESKNYKKALEFYNQIKETNSIFSLSVEDYLGQKITAIQNDFAKNEISVETATEAIEVYNGFSMLEKKLTDVRQKIKDLTTSKLSFNDGKKFYESGDYINAFASFGAVIPEDTFKVQATSLIKKDWTKIKPTYLKQINASIKENSYDLPVLSLTGVKNYVSDIDIDKKLNEVHDLQSAFLKKVAAQSKAQALSSLRKVVDSVQNANFFYDYSTTQYYNVNGFHLYMGIRGEYTPWLRLKIQYRGSNWLYIQSYIIKTDNETYTIYAGSSDVHRNSGSGYISEYVDLTVDSKNLEIIRAVATSDSAVIRYVGKQFHHDRNITKQEKQALKNILSVYDLLGGK